VKPPDWDARMAILQYHAARSGVDISRDVLTVLATRIQSDVRKLTGALRKVVAYAKLEQVEITPESVGRVLAELGIEDAA
jgi:chromosomal replication initiator protein